MLNNVRRGRRKSSTLASLEPKEKKTLMTFQVDKSFQLAARTKADQHAINMSEFLRQCVQEFIDSDEVAKVMKQLQKNVTHAALSSLKANASE